MYKDKFYVQRQDSFMKAFFLFWKEEKTFKRKMERRNSNK